MHVAVFSWELLLKLFSSVDKAGGRQDAALGKESSRLFRETGRSRPRFEVCLDAAEVNQR
jgi:hypothetical protein